MTTYLLNFMKINYIIYNISIKTTNEHIKNYESYANKLNAIKRKAERDHFSNQVEIIKSDINR